MVAQAVRLPLIAGDLVCLPIEMLIFLVLGRGQRERTRLKISRLNRLHKHVRGLIVTTLVLEPLGEGDKW